MPSLPSEFWKLLGVLVDAIRKNSLYSLIAFGLLLTFGLALVLVIAAVMTKDALILVLLVVVFAIFVALIAFFLHQLRPIITAGTSSRIGSAAESVRSSDEAPRQPMTPPSLSEAQTSLIQQLLGRIAENAALVLKVDLGNVRSNIFVPDGTALRIVPGLHFNINNPHELTIEIPPGYGSTGRSFQQKSHIIAIYREGWHQFELNEVQMRKVDPGLRWIVSVPIPDVRREGEVLGILNVDGVNESREVQDLEPLVPDLYYWARLISEFIG